MRSPKKGQKNQNLQRSISSKMEWIETTPDPTTQYSKVWKKNNLSSGRWRSESSKSRAFTPTTNTKSHNGESSSKPKHNHDDPTAPTSNRKDPAPIWALPTEPQTGQKPRTKVLQPLNSVEKDDLHSPHSLDTYNTSLGWWNHDSADYQTWELSQEKKAMRGGTLAFQTIFQGNITELWGVKDR